MACWHGAAVGIARPSLAWVPLAVQSVVPGMGQQLLQATPPPSWAELLLELSQLGPHHGQRDTDTGEQKVHSMRLLSPSISSSLWSVLEFITISALLQIQSVKLT